MREIVIYSGEEWQRVPELDAAETYAIQNEYGELRFVPKSEFVSKYMDNKNLFPWAIILGIVGGLMVV